MLIIKVKILSTTSNVVIFTPADLDLVFKYLCSQKKADENSYMKVIYQLIGREGSTQLLSARDFPITS